MLPFQSLPSLRSSGSASSVVSSRKRCTSTALRATRRGVCWQRGNCAGQRGRSWQRWWCCACRVNAEICKHGCARRRCGQQLWHGSDWYTPREQALARCRVPLLMPPRATFCEVAVGCVWCCGCFKNGCCRHRLCVLYFLDVDGVVFLAGERVLFRLVSFEQRNQRRQRRLLIHHLVLFFLFFCKNQRCLCIPTR